MSLILFLFSVLPLKNYLLSQKIGTLDDFKRSALQVTSRLFLQEKIDLKSSLYFISHLKDQYLPWEISSFGDKNGNSLVRLEIVNSHIEYGEYFSTIDFRKLPKDDQFSIIISSLDTEDKLYPFDLPKWDEIRSSENSNLPEKKDISLTLWNYERFQETEKGCLNNIPLDIYTDKNLWSRRIILINQFPTQDIFRCKIPSSTLSQLNYFVLSLNTPYNDRTIIVSAPFRIIPSEQEKRTPRIIIHNPPKGTTWITGEYAKVTYEIIDMPPGKYDVSIQLSSKTEPRGFLYDLYYTKENIISPSNKLYRSIGLYIPEILAYEKDKEGKVKYPGTQNPLSILGPVRHVSIYICPDDGSYSCPKNFIVGTSSDNIRIISGPKEPRLMILSPKGKEVIRDGTKYIIRWDSRNIPKWYSNLRIILKDIQRDRYAVLSDKISTYQNSYIWKVDLKNIKWETYGVGRNRLLRNVLLGQVYIPPKILSPDNQFIGDNNIDTKLQPSIAPTTTPPTTTPLKTYRNQYTLVIETYRPAIGIFESSVAFSMSEPFYIISNDENGFIPLGD